MPVKRVSVMIVLYIWVSAVPVHGGCIDGDCSGGWGIFLMEDGGRYDSPGASSPAAMLDSQHGRATVMKETSATGI